MSLIIIIAIIWGASALVRMSKERKRQEEMQRRAAEVERMRYEWQEERKRNAERTAAMIALKREQMRQREVERKQAEWNRKQEEKAERERRERMAADAKLAKRVEALECKVRKLDRNITATNERIGEYYGRLDWYLLQQSGTVSSGKEFRKWQDKIENVTDQIRKAENKIADMKDAKAMAEREMEVA